MNSIFLQLNNMVGTYVGEGINHESQPFIGQLTFQSILDGRGFQIHFSATGKDGTIYHKEVSTIAPAVTERLTLWNFNTNIPGLVPHELRSSVAKPNAVCSLVFGFNSPEDSGAFREEVSLDIWDINSLSYTYSWGMSGGEFKERSGVRMARQHGERP